MPTSLTCHPRLLEQGPSQARHPPDQATLGEATIRPTRSLFHTPPPTLTPQPPSPSPAPAGSSLMLTFEVHKLPPEICLSRRKKGKWQKGEKEKVREEGRGTTGKCQ